jgi:uncharacterized protein (TIGR02246 family)
MSTTNEATTRADAAAMSAIGRITAAWADNDANAFAQVFTDDATMILPGDVHVSGREQIRSFMRAGYTGPYKGTRVTGRPLSFRQVTDDVAVVTTEGGVLHAGESEVLAQRAIRASWILHRQGGEWFITAYHNSPIQLP